MGTPVDALSPTSVLHANLAHRDNLLGVALLLTPLPSLRTSGSTAVPFRLPLTHGSGVLQVKLSTVTYGDGPAAAAAGGGVEEGRLWAPEMRVQPVAAAAAAAQRCMSLDAAV